MVVLYHYHNLCRTLSRRFLQLIIPLTCLFVTTHTLQQLPPQSLSTLHTRQLTKLHALERTANRKRVVVVGATGYIGKYVTKESVRRGHETIAVVRPSADTSSEFFDGATIVKSDVTNIDLLQNCDAFSSRPDVVISCLASRSGVKEDSFLIDYQATLNSLSAATAAGAEQFVLLSAFCVRKPLLQFQQAKLQFEVALEQAHQLGKLPKYSIVRPTAFFKSVSGQLELVQQGWPFGEQLRVLKI